MGKYDLHIHTYYSDGMYSPKKIIEMASKQKLKGIAITDHDSIQSLEETKKQAGNLEIINGVEISGLESEVLGYCFDEKDEQLNKLLEHHRKQKRKYVQKKIEHLNSFGVEINYKEVLKESLPGKNPNSFTIAKVMLEKGYCKNIEQAFQEYLREIPVRLEKPPTKVKKIIKVINDAHGKAVLPHPWYLKENQKEDLETFVIRLVRYGLKGIEVNGYIPENLRKFKNKNFIEQVKKLTKKYELLECGGSDFHGEKYHPENKLGKYTTSEEIVKLLKK